MDELAEVGLASDECVWDILSSAKSGKVHNGLNWVDVVGNDDQLSGTLFNKCGHVVETELDVDWLGSLALSLLLSVSLEAELLLLLGLWLVLGEELEELGGYEN